MDDFSPSRGWSAEALARGYDLLVNGGTGAEDYLSEAGAWGMPLDQVREAVTNAALINRQREQSQLNYRANVIKALAEARAHEAAQERVERYRDENTKLRLLQLWTQMQKQPGGKADRSAGTSAFGALSGDERDATLQAMKASGLNPQDIETIDKLRAEGREDETNPQVRNQYLNARQALAEGGAAETARGKMSPMTFTDNAKALIRNAKMSEADKGIFIKAANKGDRATIEQMPGGPELMNALQKQPGQKATPPGKQSNAAEDIMSNMYASLGRAEDPRMEGTRGGGAGSRPSERGSDMSRANPFQGEPLPHPTVSQSGVGEENPMLSYFKPIDAETIARLNSTDQYGRPVNAQGNPTANWRGEPTAWGRTGAPQGTPGRADELLAALQQAHEGEARNWYEGQYVGHGAPEQGLQDTSFDLASWLPQMKGVAAGGAALGMGAGLLSKRLASQAAGRAPGYMTPGARTATQAANRTYMAPGQNVVRSPRVPNRSVPEPMPGIPEPAPFSRYSVPEGAYDALPGPGRVLELPSSAPNFATQGPRSAWTPSTRSIGEMPMALPPGAPARMPIPDVSRQLPPGQGFTMGGSRNAMPPGSPLIREMPGPAQGRNYTPPWQRQLPPPDYRPVPVGGPYGGGLPMWLRDLLF